MTNLLLIGFGGAGAALHERLGHAFLNDLAVLVDDLAVPCHDAAPAAREWLAAGPRLDRRA